MVLPMHLRLSIPVAAFLFAATPAISAQLRIVTYNTNTFSTQAPGSVIRTVRPSADVVFTAIGEELVAGIRRPADIILLQEQQQPDTTTQNLVNRLNAIYAAQGILYARGFEVGATTSGSGLGTPNGSEIRQSVVYRTDTVQLINEESFGNISVTNQPRETLLHQFRPIGYGPSADLYIFNSHFEAGDSTGFGGDRFARENEATDIRNFISANGLGNRNVMLAGDLNVDSNFERSGTSNFGGRSSLQILSDGTDASGRLLDPLFPAGGNITFHNNLSLAAIHTQSPSNGGGPLTGGGIDDRFDFLLQSDELLDREGVASIPGTHRTFGNNGSTFNDQVNDGNTIQIAGLTSFTTAQVLNALESASDHLPVIQDFQLPGILSAVAGTVPATLPQGQPFSLDITVANAAPVDTFNGADELEFSLTSFGAVSGSSVGVAFPLLPGNVISVQLDTSVLGLQTGFVQVSTSSQQASNSLISIPVSFEVVNAVTGSTTPLSAACAPQSANAGIAINPLTRPVTGTNFTVSIDDTTGTVTSAIYLLGFEAMVPTNLGVLGNPSCNLQVDLGLVVTAASGVVAAPTTLIAFPDNAPPFVGLSLALQALCTTSGPVTFVPTDTLQVLVGNQ